MNHYNTRRITLYSSLSNSTFGMLTLWPSLMYDMIIYPGSEEGVQHYVIKFLSDLQQVGGFFRVLRFPPPINLTTTIYITETLLKVALNTIKQIKQT